MRVVLLVAIPLAAGLAALLLKRDLPRRALLVGVALAHGALVASCWARAPGAAFGGWLAFDALGGYFLSIVDVLFLAAAVYATAYLEREEPGRRTDFQEGLVFSNAPEARFTACLLFFLGTMALVTLCQHLGLLWVGVEATTLASAPLIYFHRHHRSLEATWKYLLICSVGIAVALLGNLFLSISTEFGARDVAMTVGELSAVAPQLNPVWLKAAFVMLLVGYGTKMGLAPMHTWLPDAHSESPSMVSALLSGGLLNCAFLGILRVDQVCIAAGQAAFARDLLLALGLTSMGVAAVFILGQTDYKRMLAYSSVEHMGILAVGLGVGGTATFGSMLHAVNHSLAKAMLFLVSGNILAAYKTKSADGVRGLLEVLPLSGWLWLLGLFAITGSPPFGPFLSELTILRGAVEQGRFGVAAAFVVLLAVIFVGMATPMLKMVHGAAPAEVRTYGRREALGVAAPPVALAIGVTALGVWLAAPLASLLHAIASSLGGA